ncbi:MAG: hypothetical protein ACK58L_07600 [Planctomycetota bacterium]
MKHRTTTEFASRRRFAMLQAFLSAIFAMIASTPCPAQEGPKLRIADVIWGFDDRVIQGQFVPVSILVDNLSGETFEGKLTLNCVQGMLNEVGGDLEKEFFISGTSRQWVQFYPHISDSAATWNLTLKTSDQEIRFDPIPKSRRLFEPEFNNKFVRKPERMTAVILDSSAKISRIPTSIKHMPEEIFPPYATATHGLYAMFLDHHPDWDVPRQEACMGWLRRGGRLHLLKDSNNQQIRFSGAMAPLNEPNPEFRVGHGMVTRHDYQRENLPDAVANQILTQQLPDPDQEETAEELAAARQFRASALAPSAAEFFEGLRSLTASEHNWFLLTLLALMYVGVLFPGSWILSKQPRLPFYTTYAAIGAGVLLFSLIFLFFGRRGYGESTAMNSLMVARHEGDGRWDVRGMSQVFVTTANTYSVEDNGHETLLASGSDFERVSGTFVSGNSAKFTGLLPPFSGQPILSQRRVEIDDWELRITDFSQSSSQLTKLTIETSRHFPSGSQVTCRILHGRILHSAAYDSSKRLLTLGSMAQKLRSFDTRSQSDATKAWNWGSGTPPMNSVPDTQPLEDPRLELFRQAESDLLVKSLQDDFVDDLDRYEMPPGEIRLLVYAPIPTSMDLPFSAEAKRDGRVLFVRPMRLELTDSAQTARPIE